MTSEEFAEKNAGKYFLYRGLKVRVVGYNSVRTLILVTIPRGAKSIGWRRDALDREDILVISTRASKFWYADIEELIMDMLNSRKPEEKKITAKRFAREYAGEYFLYGDKKVRVVGYYKRGRDTFVLVTGIGGWEMKYVENRPEYVITTRVQANRVYYVKLKDLMI